MRFLGAGDIRPGLAVVVTVRPSRRHRRERTVRGEVREVGPRHFVVHTGLYREAFLLKDVDRGRIRVALPAGEVRA